MLKFVYDFFEGVRTRVTRIVISLGFRNSFSTIYILARDTQIPGLRNNHLLARSFVANSGLDENQTLIGEEFKRSLRHPAIKFPVGVIK